MNRAEIANLKNQIGQMSTDLKSLRAEVEDLKALAQEKALTMEKMNKSATRKKKDTTKGKDE